MDKNNDIENTLDEIFNEYAEHIFDDVDLSIFSIQKEYVTLSSATHFATTSTIPFCLNEIIPFSISAISVFAISNFTDLFVVSYGRTVELSSIEFFVV